MVEHPLVVWWVVKLNPLGESIDLFLIQAIGL